MPESAVQTSREAIVAYWSQRIYEGEMGTDWDDALHRCWRCADEHKNLDRCHIIARQAPLDGADEPSNFVLLCPTCHREAPSVPDPAVIWLWIKKTHSPHYGQFWVDRQFGEYERIYGPIERATDWKSLSVRMFLENFAYYQDQVGIHGARSYRDSFSLASNAWAMHEAIAACNAGIAHSCSDPADREFAEDMSRIINKLRDSRRARTTTGAGDANI